MLNWIRCHSAGLFTTLFVFGAVCAVLVAALGHTANARLLAVGGLVCIGALVVTLLARITIWCAKKFMSESMASMRWLELTTDQFLTLETPARIALFAGLIGLFAAAFGFGWLSSTMIFVIFRSN